MSLFKLSTVVLIAVAIQLTAFGQETVAGKANAATFWKAIEGNRPVQAKSSLDSLKKREPNFDVSKMEKALADLNEKRNAAVTVARADVQSKQDADKMLDAIFARSPKSSSFDKPDAVTATINDNNNMTLTILRMDQEAIKRELDSARRAIRAAMPSNEGKNAELVKSINEALDAKVAERYYSELDFRRAFWTNAGKLFPDEPGLKEAFLSVTVSIATVGSAEQRAARANKNAEAIIDAERLPKGIGSSPKLERWFQDVFTDTSQMRGRNYTFLRAVVLDTDYNITRNEVTGAIIRRSRGAAIAFKDADGKCKYGRYAITQQYSGGQFTGGELSMDFDHKELRCSNVK